VRQWRDVLDGDDFDAGAAIERMAVSRPDPGPRTSTSTFFTPCSIAARAHFSAASCAAYGVDLRDP